MNNIFEYKIYKNVYDSIVSGEKTIEMRLMSEKAERIKKGDIINFKVLDSEQIVTVEVVGKHIFDTIDELCQNKDILLKSSMNYSKEELINLMYEIYGKEKVINSRIVGFEFILR